MTRTTIDIKYIVNLPPVILKSYKTKFMNEEKTHFFNSFVHFMHKIRVYGDEVQILNTYSVYLNSNYLF